MRVLELIGANYDGCSSHIRSREGMSDGFYPGVDNIEQIRIHALPLMRLMPWGFFA